MWYCNSIATLVFAANRSKFCSGAAAPFLCAILALSVFLPCTVAEEKQDHRLIENSVGLRMVMIRPGKFNMGAPITEVGSRIDEQPVHEVEITTPFFLGVHEVTQAEYEKVVGVNPSSCTSGNGCGAEDGCRLGVGFWVKIQGAR